ncbi:MAG TPA: cupin-like domain-containing protein [Polyangiaceae bacterium]|nr:cupin-like domain-containing protein [Polyangiaceae bacterium]
MPTIDRLALPRSREEFAELAAGRRPLLFPRAVEDWPAVSKWTQDYLRSRIGPKELTVTVSSREVFEGDLEKGHYHCDQMHNMTFDAFLDGISETPSRHYNLHRQNLETTLPELYADVRVPGIIPDRGFLLPALWMGPRGSVTQLHHDFADNLFAQVRGRKRVLLADPQQEGAFYRFPYRTYGERSSWHLSLVKTSLSPDLASFPDFAGVELYDFEMSPGDLLYMPAFWWHEIHALDQPTISISFWWDTRGYDDVLRTIVKITALAEEYGRLPPHWQAFIERLFVKGVFAPAKRS